MLGKHVIVAGIGTWLPEEVLLNDAWPQKFIDNGLSREGERTFNDMQASEDPTSAAIVARYLEAEAGDPFLGSVRRHKGAGSDTAHDAEAAATMAALDDAGIDPKDVDLIMSHSMIPERVTPPTALSVQRLIGAKNAYAMGVETVCASTIAQLDVAEAFIRTGKAKVAVLCSSHLMSRAFPFMHPARPSLGDGATALVVTSGNRGIAVRSTFSRSHGEYDRAVCFVRGSDDASDPSWWEPGGAIRLGSRNHAQAMELVRETVSFGAKTVTEAAAAAGVWASDIDVLVSVQPRGFVPAAIAERLGLPPACGVATFKEIAHLGACGVGFNLSHARNLELLVPGALIGVYAQGAGFTRSAAILEVID